MEECSFLLPLFQDTKDMDTQASTAVRRGASQAPDARAAIEELASQLTPQVGDLVVFFASPSYDRAELQDALNDRFDEQVVIGCTTAGEFGPTGYQEESLSGFTLSATEFDVELTLVPELADMELDRGTHVMQAAMNRMRSRGIEPTAEQCFAFLLVDGLSMREEALVSALHRPLGDIHLFGGSAGDNLDFGQTQIFVDGEFHHNAAVVALVHTELPFEVFRTQHFLDTDHKMVITEADVQNRIVTEINGAPAAREYASVVGLELDELTPQVFAAHPVLVRVGGENYVRSIAKVNEDGSLSFFCAIEAGNVLTVAQGEDLVGSLERSFEGVRERVGEPLLTIGCDCILRSLEMQRAEIRGQVAEVLNRNRAVGFATYGEQFDAMHVNQTFTGVMIGERKAA